MLCRMATPPGNRQGSATRTRLIKTAERLFATQGVDAVSVRAVNAAAGLGPASVHYHFGSKDDLLAAVLLDMGVQVRDQIITNVAGLASDPQRPSAETLVRALTDPYLNLVLRQRTRGMRWVKIVAQLSPEGHPALTATGHDVANSLLAQVRRAFPDSDPHRLEMRWAIAIAGYLEALSRADDWARDGRTVAKDELAAFHEDLVLFVVGGVERLLGA